MKKHHTIATAAEMRELLNLDSLQPVNVGPNWTSYGGGPFHTHIRWSGDGVVTMFGTKDEAYCFIQWIQNELHTGNE